MVTSFSEVSCPDPRKRLIRYNYLPILRFLKPYLFLSGCYKAPGCEALLSQSEVEDGIKKHPQNQKTVKVSDLVAKGKEAPEEEGACGKDFRAFPWERTLQFQGVVIYFLGLLFNVKHKMQR